MSGLNPSGNRRKSQETGGRNRKKQEKQGKFRKEAERTGKSGKTFGSVPKGRGSAGITKGGHVCVPQNQKCLRIAGLCFICAVF
jgi:hypothetical protein